MKIEGIRVYPLFFLVAWFMFPGLGQAAAEVRLSAGQLVYVPAYSHIYYGDREKQFLLTITLSIRNTDPARTITISKVDYYDSDGKPVRSYLQKPLSLKPLASTRFIVPESDHRGGSGASFIVQWQADAKVNPPLLEGVMIGASGQQGISFTSRGVEIKK
jgi:hypothetical protein